jgi:geranylgeranyl pyrophosphate synthase
MGPLPQALRPVAVAIECFHKASLVHDDIEDGDVVRYGEETLHAQHGVPIALNVGDLLLGEGYRLIAEAGFAPERAAEMLRAVADAHRTLCVGQGEELAWAREPKPLSAAEVLEIFRKKTAPAFEVALRLGALCAGAGDGLRDVLKRYSVAVGTAYQIRDDLDDFAGRNGDLLASRPSLLLALAHEQAGDSSRVLTEGIWRGALRGADLEGRLESLFATLPVEAAAQEMLDYYKFEAIRSLAALDTPNLKGLLRRVIGRIFNEIEVMGCCDDNPAADAASGGRGSEAAA